MGKIKIQLIGEHGNLALNNDIELDIDQEEDSKFAETFKTFSEWLTEYACEIADELVKGEKVYYCRDCHQTFTKAEYTYCAYCGSGDIRIAEEDEIAKDEEAGESVDFPTEENVICPHCKKEQPVIEEEYNASNGGICDGEYRYFSWTTKCIECGASLSVCMQEDMVETASIEEGKDLSIKDTDKKLEENPGYYCPTCDDYTVEDIYFRGLEIDEHNAVKTKLGTCNGCGKQVIMRVFVNI